MIENCKKYWLPVLVVLLAVATAYIFYLDWRLSQRGLTVAVLNVGQGDAIFIESPTGAQVLIDAGAPRKVLGELSRVMPPFDRKLDAIIMTHPDNDHIGGFSEVLRNYKVGFALEPGSESDSQSYRNLKSELAAKNVEVILARRDMVLHLGDGVSLRILFPDRDVSGWTTNESSIVARLDYGGESFLFTGDSTSEIEKVLIENGELLASDFLKVGHHGSRTSTGEAFALAVKPSYALISAGKNNRYGHPHPDVLGVLEGVGAEILRTDEMGTIVIKCDRIEPCKIKKLRN